MDQSYITGFVSSLSLIAAIGAQNAFVIQQGAIKSNMFIVCGVCISLDMILMSLGVLGLGAFILEYTYIHLALLIGGILFLSYYSFTCLQTIFKKSAIDINSQGRTLGQTMILTLAISLLNPHVYIDTVLLIGLISLSSLNSSLFLLGTFSASLVWFSFLGSVSYGFSFIFQNPKVWQALHILIVLMMLYIIYILAFDLYGLLF